MTQKTLTRADLSEAVHKKIGLSRVESISLVDMVIDEICDALVEEGAVRLSSFGSFYVRNKSQRIGRNPKTGEEVVILPRRVLSFKASQLLKDRILRTQRKKHK